MTENHDKMTENLEMMTSNHYKMKDIHDRLTDNPEKLTTISPHPGLTFSYHKVLMPVTKPEQGLGGDKYVVGLSIRKLKADSEDLM